MMDQSRRHLWDLVNSQVGVLVIGFLLATVLGSLLTDRIQRAATEHKIRFSRFHEDQAVAIRSLNEKIVDVEESLRNLYYKYRPIGINPVAEDEVAIATSVRALRTQFEKSRIYFSPEVSATLDAVCAGLQEAFRELENAYIRKGLDPSHRGNPDFVETKFMLHFEQSKAARRELEAAFRTLVGSI